MIESGFRACARAVTAYYPCPPESQPEKKEFETILWLLGAAVK